MENESVMYFGTKFECYDVKYFGSERVSMVTVYVL
jgi:hypothetical protein